MELRQLRYFVVVAEELNLQRASKRLHICAPPLLMQMRKLQDSIGVELFRTNRGRLELTDGGRAFLDEARAVLGCAERAVTQTRLAANGEVGRLIVGCNAVAEFGVLPHIVAAFKRARPRVELVLRSLRTPQQVADLAENRLDVGFVCPPIPTDAFDVQELSTQPFVAVVPRQHPLSEAPAVSFEALSDTPLITYSRKLDPHSFGQIEAHFQRAGAQMQVAYEAETSFSMIALAAAGNGCCIVPEYARQFTNLGVVCRPLAAAQIERTLAIIKRKSRDGLAEAFFQFAVAQVSRLVPRLQVARMQAAASLYQADSMPSMAGGG